MISAVQARRARPRLLCALLAPTLAPILVLALATASPVALGQPGSEAGRIQSELPGSLFDRVMQLLADSDDPQQRHTFADIALYHLQQAYWNEAELARGEAERQGKVLGWARSVAREAQRLGLLREAAAQGMPIGITRLPRGNAIIYIGDQRVLLNPPRPEQQAALESQILADFCLQGCRELVAMLPPAASASSSPLASSDNPSRRQVVWQFNEQGVQCQSSALRLQFSDRRQLPDKRTLCQQLFTELDAVLAALDWHRQRGVDIDWSALRVHTSGPQRAPQLDSQQHSQLDSQQHSQQQLTLNRSGDSALISLPLLAAQPGLLTQIRPWLAGQLQQRAVSVEIDGDALLPAADS